MQIPPIRKTDGTWVRNNEQKAQGFSEHLEHTFQPQEIQEETETTSEDIVQENDEINPTTTAEVNNEINKILNTKKAPGFDLITGEVLQQLPRKATVKITKHINAVLACNMYLGYGKRRRFS